MTETTLTVPAHIAARIEARKAQDKPSGALAAVLTGGDQIPRISIRAARFRLVDEGVETMMGIELDVVIIAVNPAVSRHFYLENYNPDADGYKPPDCFSLDGVAPDSSCESPQMDVCAKCPNNVLGSKITPSGAKAKLCGEIRNLAVVSAGDPSKVYNLPIPVTSMKGLRGYFKHLQNYGTIPEEVVTTLGFDSDVSYPKITFALKSFLGEAAIPVIERMATEPQALIATRQIRADGSEITPHKGLPAGAVSAAAPAKLAPSVEEPKAATPKAAKPVPVLAPEPEEVESAPVVEDTTPDVPEDELTQAINAIFDVN